MSIYSAWWRITHLLLAIGLGSASAVAQTFDDAGVQAFVDACSHVGFLSEIEAYLRCTGFTPAPKNFAERLLHGGPGNVWLMLSAAHVAVVTQPDGMLCRVYVQGGDVTKELSYFKRIIEGIARPGLVVTKTSDGDIATNNGPARYVAYRVVPSSSKAGTIGRFFSIATTNSPTASLSTVMTVGVTKTD